MKSNKNILIFLGIIFCFIILTLINFRIYTRTIIGIKVIAFLYLVGILFFLPINKIFKKKVRSNNFINFCFCILLGCVITTFALTINFLFAKSKITAKTFKIEEKIKLPSKFIKANENFKIIFVKINSNQVKSFTLKTDNIHNADSIILQTSNGFLNYPIIRNIELN